MKKDSFIVGRDVEIHPTAKIIGDDIEIGDFSKIGPNVIVSGRGVKIGREAWLGESAIVGGGRAEVGSLEAGDFLHLGIRSQVNLANEVVIGDEVGIGMNGMVFSHGAYLSEYDGFPYQDSPVSIGSNVWLPYAMVTPGVNIGDNVVVAAMSLVNIDLPTGCLAGGIPAKILKQNYFPREVTLEQKNIVLNQLIKEAAFYGVEVVRDTDGETLTYSKTIFDLAQRRIEGLASKETEKLKDILRRHGIRFRYYNDGEYYKEWD
jgi:acetyltransferase-like isoleucine patch superfamily enzyme